MSRSYRRVPYIRYERKDCHYLNRKIRRAKLAEIPSGGAYRRMFIDGGWDWGYIWTKEQAMQDYETKPWLREEYTLEQWLNSWERWALRK